MKVRRKFKRQTERNRREGVLSKLKPSERETPGKSQLAVNLQTVYCKTSKVKRMNCVRQVFISCILIRVARACVCVSECVSAGGWGGSVRSVNAGLSLHKKGKGLIEAGLQAPE